MMVPINLLADSPLEGLNQSVENIRRMACLIRQM